MLLSDVDSRSNFPLCRSREPPLASVTSLDHLAAASAKPPPIQPDSPPVPDAATAVGGFVPYQPPAALAAMARIPITNVKQEPVSHPETVVKQESGSECALYLHHPFR